MGRIALDRAREFLAHNRIAVVGVSRDEKDFSRRVLRALVEAGYEVVPVNPALDVAEGRACYPHVQDVKPPVHAALLLTPVHRWWTYVLAVVPVHLLAQIGTVHPPALIAALFVTNWSEALLGAIGVRLFSDAPARLDTFQRMAIFIGAVGL